VDGAGANLARALRSAWLAAAALVATVVVAMLLPSTFDASRAGR
jgi:hypothetical protein